MQDDLCGKLLIIFQFKKKDSTVILTTHSMEEAEALSTKLAIMVEGKIKTIGSI